jgi:hypothetical protein
MSSSARRNSRTARSDRIFEMQASGGRELQASAKMDCSIDRVLVSNGRFTSDIMRSQHWRPRSVKVARTGKLKLVRARADAQMDSSERTSAPCARKRALPGTISCGRNKHSELSTASLPPRRQATCSTAKIRSAAMGKRHRSGCHRERWCNSQANRIDSVAHRTLPPIVWVWIEDTER